ncbi:MAG: phosphate acyltransferase PlsX [Alphaproteobacteria bacterium]|nr:phosphate acyltransferase PlsX [Alphaproteobacteria bacterium]
MLKIGIDIMGGDFAPDLALKSFSLLPNYFWENFRLVCFGDTNLFQKYGVAYKIPFEYIECIPCSDEVGYHDTPTKAFKEKPNASIFQGFRYLANNTIHAYLSAGNTGAMLVGIKTLLEPVKGIIRPALISLLPKISGKFGLTVDVGLNIDCKPEYLDQFAILASIFAEEVLKIKNPSVGLINIGEEEGKGNLLSQNAFKLLQSNALIHFIGNKEGRDIFTDDTDVMVCDGFVGNILLKLAESLYNIASERGLDKDIFFSKFNYENYGGMPILGISKPVIIGHGISNEVAFKNMILLAQKMVDADICQKIEQKINHLS